MMTRISDDFTASLDQLVNIDDCDRHSPTVPSDTRSCIFHYSRQMANASRHIKVFAYRAAKRTSLGS
jgi:hypothetical protein